MSIQLALICDICRTYALAGEGVTSPGQVRTLAGAKRWHRDSRAPGDRTTRLLDICPGCIAGGAA